MNIIFPMAAMLLPSCSAFVAPLQPIASMQSATHMAMAMGESIHSDDANGDEMMKSSNVFDRRKIIAGAGGLLASSFLNFGNDYRAIAIEEATVTAKKEFPSFTLPNDVKMPVLALNTVGLSADETARACELATSNGFRHFDFHPGKERDGVAKFIQKDGGKLPRKELFLTTKIRKPPVGTTPAEAEELAKKQIEEDLAAFGSNSYFDMLMIRDSPDCEVMRAQWKVLEQALKDGKTRSVGVINFCEESLRCILKGSKVTPAVNYYYYHVGMNTGKAYKLREFCDRKKIKTFAYGAVGEPGPYLDDRILKSSVLLNIGDSSKVYNRRNHGEGDKSPEEIAIKWVIDTGAAVSVRPTTNFGLGKSACSAANDECEVGIKKRAKIFDWDLTGEEIYKLSNIPTLKSEDNPTLFSSAGCPGERPIP
eukprot:CAMPEP_0116141604 /NCGR_PEP_ID=MMETSP0329-20121206/14468_1 /TAXON_ID=697910 /ORGANISM="Pseudo-nitzschia arenysensis, Strain B593" /LENGTH=422 /DNA_ID=CAMNT_0003636793 /DNA_START=179 /DNA_END=1447 /DNA_ORIENTATION=+